MNLYRVEFPGYVKNQDKAIQMLGGEHEIYTQLSSETPSLKFSFRPDDQLSHKIESESTTDPCILIRIRAVRKYVLRNGRKVYFETKLIPEYVGKAIQTNRFISASDFQFLPPLNSTLNEPTVSTPVQQSFLYLPPPVFLHNYHYPAQYIQKRLFSARQVETSKIWKSECTWLVNQNDLHAMINGPSPPNPLPEYIPEFVMIFQELFEIRPIWTLSALYDAINQREENRGNILEMNEQNPQIFHSLACVAYHIKDGPFQLCWVKYGINPLMSNNYRTLQTVTLSLKFWDYAEQLIKRTNKSNKYKAKKIKELPLNATKVCALPDRLFFSIQLCDIDEALVKEELENVSDNFSFSSGWYSTKTIEYIRKFILLKLQRLILDTKSVSPSIIMSDISSWKMVQDELSNKPQTKDEEGFDFELLTKAQSILELYDTDGNETIGDFIDIISFKTCNVSIERMFSF